jgi:hypothetical protein
MAHGDVPYADEAVYIAIVDAPPRTSKRARMVCPPLESYRSYVIVDRAIDASRPRRRNQ